MTTEFRRFDLLRVDHFRGFEACWEIPAVDVTAVNGRWVKAPGDALFESLLRHFGSLAKIQEASAPALGEVENLNEKDAQTVFDFFHPKRPESGDADLRG